MCVALDKYKFTVVSRILFHFIDLFVTRDFLAQCDKHLSLEVTSLPLSLSPSLPPSAAVAPFIVALQPVRSQPFSLLLRLTCRTDAERVDVRGT